MDGREAMALSSGSNPYYIHRGPDFGGSGGYGSQSGSLHPPPQFRTSSTQNYQLHNNGMPGSSASAFSIEHSNVNSGHDHHGHGDGIDRSAPPEMSVNEQQPVKKKRGRPRKYAPDGQVSLGLSPMLIKPKQSSEQDPLSPSKRKGRPPGTGRKQRLANLGEWMNKSAGLAFAPHVISILAGEDIVAKILSFAQQRPRAVCIMSGTGTASSVTLRQPASTEPTVTYELVQGRFQILCLSGSYLVAEDGGPRDRTGGISASLSTPDGQVIGGAIGMLTAATLVQVVICSFVYGGTKKPERPVGRPKSDKSQRSSEKVATPASAPPPTAHEHHYTPSPMGVWPGSRSVDLRNPHMDIDLTQG
ncbi:AT-hook motif nuclear-localized protein 5 [Linum grandiflorum]